MTYHTLVMPKKTFYLTQQNKDKINLVRGPLPASRVINKALEYLPENTLRSLLDLPPLEAKTPTIEPLNPHDTTTTEKT